MKKEEELISVTEACKRFGITRQALFICIRSKRLKAEKIKNRWYFTAKAWNDYVNSKYSREYSIRDGLNMYDIKNGVLSPSMVSEQFGLEKQQIYYLLRKGVIPDKRMGCAYILSKNDVKNSLNKIKIKKYNGRI